MTSLLWLTTALARWFRLKVYQYEVTFAIYMLTPTEKFIFNSLLLTLLTMIVTGMYVYLPDHIRAIYSHLYYYWVGERPFISSNLSSISSVFRENGTKTLEMVYDTVTNTAAAATTNPIAEL
ncbi:serine palmitoyltransferase small subunit family protein [Aspergillus clavatus NRRL 1]|uniref:Uncharacterized protein n=1 Tax=Aspergillus clavatus (strain ATCC 1007 / CBS 513.65 / DSM 816 / NCTC 3887 / NRRL 1 / QM 1276 / 107) TaxID=344612 RepID=A1CMB6_ASPCL|nr:uncharacterized protein ACLA_096360 [Aspergillus clavatus NRRL 1]EAW08703.1 conserved hypothetical protein [Aspergillus clavatus NRRL 1]